jgi:putative ABC transport system permease protein
VKAILLGYEFWQRAFNGDPQIIGKTVRISRWDVPPTVVGVMQPGLRFLPSPGAAKEPNYDVNATVDFWIPAAPDPKYLKAPYWNVVARLGEGIRERRGQQELTLLAAREAQSEKEFEGFTPQLESVAEESNRDGRRILLPLLGAAALVLLIGCGNAAALMLVRGLQRQQEYAVRTALGMGRTALLRQVATESLLVALMGGACGVGLAFGVVRLFKLIAAHAVPRLDGVTAGWSLLGWGLGAAVLASVFAGVLPALRAVRLDPDGSIEERGTERDGGNGRAAIAAWSHDGADGTDAGAAGGRRTVDPHDGEYRAGPVRL